MRLTDIQAGKVYLARPAPRSSALQPFVVRSTGVRYEPVTRIPGQGVRFDGVEGYWHVSGKPATLLPMLVVERYRDTMDRLGIDPVWLREQDEG